MAKPHKVLILGGTTEAAALAEALSADPRIAVTTSLAGRTRRPAALSGELRSGGFGGAEGLTAYLSAQTVDLLIDATHAFAAQISGHAAEASVRAGVPRLQLLRPAWTMEHGDDWRCVADLAHAAEAIAASGARRVFLSIGSQELGAFASLEGVDFLVRMIDAPQRPLPLRRAEVLLGRGPFREADEIALLRERGIELVVAKNSGGAATYAKIAAARALGLPVVMVERPILPDGECVGSVEEALAWIAARAGEPPRAAAGGAV